MKRRSPQHRNQRRHMLKLHMLTERRPQQRWLMQHMLKQRRPR